MAKTTTEQLKEYEQYANEAVDEQAILDKYNAATAAQYAIQRDQNRLAENQFYNQMYNTQKTAMDTIRQSNAAAVSTGASRGVQAAQELSALLGLQQESVAGATEIAQARRQTAQEETAATLDNVLKAYTEAQTERANLIQSMVQQDSIHAQREGQLVTAYLQAIADGNTAAASVFATEMQRVGIAVPQVNTQPGTTSPDTTQPNVNPGGTVKVDPIGAVIKSGIGADGKMYFDVKTLSDPENNKDTIYKVLKAAGWDISDATQQIVDINNTATYKYIAQTDLNENEQKGKAGDYINAIKTAAKEGKIPIGAVLNLNYGDSSENIGFHVYLGNGKFARIEPHNATNKELTRAEKIWVPEGYQTTIRHDLFGNEIPYDPDIHEIS